MKFTLFSGLALAALATANPIGDELLERATKTKCTNGVQSGGGQICSFNVSCGVQGIPTGTPEFTSTGASLNTCIYNCSTYGQFHGGNCFTFNYKTKGKLCSLYSAPRFASQTPNKGYDSGEIDNCNG